MRFPAWVQLATTDIDNMSPVFNRLCDRAGEVKLRARRYGVLRAASENRDNQPAARRCNSLNRPVVLTEDNTGYVGSVPRSRATVSGSRDKAIDRMEVGPLETGMRLIDRTVEDRFRYARITERFSPEWLQSWPNRQVIDPVRLCRCLYRDRHLPIFRSATGVRIRKYTTKHETYAVH